MTTTRTRRILLALATVIITAATLAALADPAPATGFALALGTPAATSAPASGIPGRSPATQPAGFWPPYPDDPRIQFLVAFQKSTDVQLAKTAPDQPVIGKEPPPPLWVTKPFGVAMAQGKIYVCDLRGGCVILLDLRQHRVLAMGKEGEILQSPTAIAIAPDGMKYVADAGKNLIAVFDAQDRPAGKLEIEGFNPVNVAVYKDELYVSDFKSQTVKVMDRGKGGVLRTISAPGEDAGQFVRPLGLAVDAKGDLFVADVFKCNVQKFDREGKLAATIGGNAADVGGLVRPKHMAVDADGILYVVDAAFQNVQLYDEKGRVLTFFGSAGDHPGAMYLPAGICVNDGNLDLFTEYIHPAFEAQRLIVVTNQFGDSKVSVYALGHLRAGKTVADVAGSKGLIKSVRGAATQPVLLPK